VTQKQGSVATCSSLKGFSRKVCGAGYLYIKILLQAYLLKSAHFFTVADQDLEIFMQTVIRVKNKVGKIK
jgi:hypothetical protein